MPHSNREKELFEHALHARAEKVRVGQFGTRPGVRAVRGQTFEGLINELVHSVLWIVPSFYALFSTRETSRDPLDADARQGRWRCAAAAPSLR